MTQTPKARWVRQSSRIALILAAGGWAAAAQAQNAPDDVADETAASDQEIVVTGSNIKGASDSGAIAVTTLSKEEIDSFGASSTGEIMEYIAQAGSAEINGAADGPNDARGDVATVNLRGLGTGNTLILLNGRRIAAHAANQDIGSTPRQIVNVNAFPATGIDRVEVLRDGASALYGSDATAGVVNTILDANFRRNILNFEYSTLEGTKSDEITVDGGFGLEFNQGRTRVMFSGSYYDRNGLFSSELGGQFNTVDKRAFLGDSPFATETTDFRNTSTSSPFGQFQVGSVNSEGVFVGQRVRQGTTALTSTTGVFHIQPCDFAGTRAVLGTGSEGCMGLDDGSLDAVLRYDFGANQPNNSLNEGVNVTNDPITAKGRQLISSAKRYNAYANLEHEFGSGVELFSEALYYRATTSSNRAAQPVDSGLAFLIVPASNYWNPFGAVGSPNRLPGLNATDVPAEGRDVLLVNWRPTDLGPRFIDTKTETYRLLAGLRGQFGQWDWEGAIATSGNRTADTESNRLSKTLLAAELAKSTPDAINPFGGPNANTQEQWGRVRISNTNVGKTTLTTADFRISNSAAFDLIDGPVGLAFGAEWRHDYYEEDRDPRLDGTIIFSDENVSGISDVVGVSPTRDSSAGRDVFSAFGEALVPLHRGEGTFINDLTLQLAVRGEYFNDINDGAVKPKVALSWFPVEAFNLRAAYSQGFRVPNLVQLNRGDVSRLNLGNEDYYRRDVTGDPVSTGDAYLASVRQSNPNLENEDTETIVVGATLDLKKAFSSSAIRRFAINVDYWRFEQKGVIGAFGDQEALPLDFLLRQQGSSNPNVVRAPVTAADQAAFDAYNAANPDSPRQAAGQVLYVIDPYINLDRQIADGFDFGLATSFDAGSAGIFRFGIEATYLNRLDVVRNELLAALADNPAFAGDFAALQVDRIKLDGNPRWRGTATFGWRLKDFSMGGSVRYVSDMLDTSADITVDGETVYWKVKEDWRVNLYGEYRFRLGDRRDIRLRLGVNNVFDGKPPLVDESYGYYPEYHSVKPREFYVQLRGSF
ncbi:TonB-dependent receptor [Sphingopyxis sp. XHP0097]|uniref:TonB-dependent receptor n=1 Tax=Sphingopyxis jiangsuensis TaxID=2871171 RepID=A0ABS7MJZ3_9SPHN|nr:TonB-dependent receptor [Sphingopyxis jiangsuensis]MBY4638386.1 TonB-dependent receptor [Sphingopyxis jiangsuensis]